MYHATISSLLDKHLKYALTQFLPCFLKKWLTYYTTLSLCFSFRKVGDSVTWIYLPTIMSHLISASVRLRFTLNIVTSRYVTRGIESFMRFAECRDPNSQSIHTSVDARRLATYHATFVANQQDFICWQLGTAVVWFVTSLKATSNARSLCDLRSVSHFNLSCI